MKHTFKSIRNIFNWNTPILIILSSFSTYICISKSWLMDLPMTIIGIAVVFPIVFSIGGAYKRREVALVYYGNIKALSRMMYFASRDWLRDDDNRAKENIEEFKNLLVQTMAIIRKFFMTKTIEDQLQKEEELYITFSKLSKTVEVLRDRGLSGSEVSRVHSFLSKLIMAFESFKHIFQYRTPRTLRTYSRVFIFVIPILYAPCFAFIADGKPVAVALILPTLFSLIFTSLDNIQEHLENPFDQVGEDDIKINCVKFERNLEL
jgi:predicted membrane chloride channel (bestrophin family)